MQKKSLQAQKLNKSKRKVFGYFRTETKAQAYMEHMEKFHLKQKNTYSFFTTKRKRPKSHLKSWFAYALYNKTIPQ